MLRGEVRGAFRSPTSKRVAGPVLVLLHGFLFDSRAYRATSIESLSNHFRVIALGRTRLQGPVRPIRQRTFQDGRRAEYLAGERWGVAQRRIGAHVAWSYRGAAWSAARFLIGANPNAPCRSLVHQPIRHAGWTGSLLAAVISEERLQKRRDLRVSLLPASENSSPMPTRDAPGPQRRSGRARQAHVRLPPRRFQLMALSSARSDTRRPTTSEDPGSHLVVWGEATRGTH